MILVTGAAGQCGSALVREFARQNQAVRALVRDRAKAAALESLPTVEVVEGDMLRADTLAPALDGVDQVFMSSSSNAQMVDTQCTFIDACKKAGVRQLLKLSGAEAGIGFDQSKFRFTRMHLEIERYLENSGLGWTHLRPGQFMQVYLREARTIATKGTLCLPFDGIKLSPVDVADIAKIAFAILRDRAHAGESYPITGPEALTMAEVAGHISGAIGKPVRYVPITIEERRKAALAAGVPPFMADALDEQALERCRHPEAKIDVQTHQKFGVRPTTFAEFATRHASAFQ